MPCAEILSRMGSTSRLMNSSGGRSPDRLALERDQGEFLAETVLTSSRLRCVGRNVRQRPQAFPGRGAPTDVRVARHQTAQMGRVRDAAPADHDAKQGESDADPEQGPATHAYGNKIEQQRKGLPPVQDRKRGDQAGGASRGADDRRITKLAESEGKAASAPGRRSFR